MPRGGLRPGAGRKPKPTRPHQLRPRQHQPRPRFDTAQAFGLWALNASDDEVSMEHKIRVLQVLAMLEAKQAPPAKPAEPPGHGRYAPRRVREFGVIEGGAGEG